MPLKLLSLALFSALFLSACNPPREESIAIQTPIITEVTRETYLSGKEFCEIYEAYTTREFGRYIQVPKDYKNKTAGTLEVYVYTMSPFDPSKHSYIYLDGGPGQNTHGLMPEYLGGKFNEIRFDQRGLGCSAPDTYDMYKNSDLYSSENTVEDIELVRKAMGIEKWSVYGVSYGTVPATMYGAKYPKNTSSVVLEGVFGDSNKIHLLSYKAEKINMVLREMTPAQRVSYSQLMVEKSADREILYNATFRLFYSDQGMRTLGELINLFIEKDGTIRRDLFEESRVKAAKTKKRFELPQQPGAVDGNIMDIIYCKNLDSRNLQEQELRYSESLGFFAIDVDSRKNENTCDQGGVSQRETSVYKIRDNPVQAPVYYFQGSHDGATMAIGAIEHWKTVPQGKSYFMLAQKGGHHPNLSRLEGRSFARKYAQRKLFFASVNADDITQGMIATANEDMDPEQAWKLYLAPASDNAAGDLEGIHRNFTPET